MKSSRPPRSRPAAARARHRAVEPVEGAVERGSSTSASGHCAERRRHARADADHEAGRGHRARGDAGAGRPRARPRPAGRRSGRAAPSRACAVSRTLAAVTVVMLDWHARRLRRLDRAHAPGLPGGARAARRALGRSCPAAVQTDAQVLGRRFAGCEGTHGVFPRCNLACTPCYHAKEAQQVRTDGAHTVAEVERQMAYLEQVRGPAGHAQLIGGEVTLLSPGGSRRDPRGHAPPRPAPHEHEPRRLRLRLPRAAGRRRRRVAARFKRIAFAGHFDSLMLGRRGLPRPRVGGRAAPLSRAVRGDVRAPARRARGPLRPRPQHDGDAAQPRRGRGGRARLQDRWASG